MRPACFLTDASAEDAGVSSERARRSGIPEIALAGVQAAASPSRLEMRTISTRAARDLVICQLSRGVGTPLLELHCLISLASPSTRVSGWTTRLGCRGVQGRVSRKVRHLALRGCAVTHSR